MQAGEPSHIVAHFAHRFPTKRGRGCGTALASLRSWELLSPARLESEARIIRTTKKRTKNLMLTPVSLCRALRRAAAGKVPKIPLAC